MGVGWDGCPIGRGSMPAGRPADGGQPQPRAPLLPVRSLPRLRPPARHQPTRALPTRGRHRRRGRPVPARGAGRAHAHHDPAPHGRRPARQAAIEHDADAVADELRQTIADCDAKLGRYRAALEAGADATLVAGWTKEATTIKSAAQAWLGAHPGKPARMSEAEIKATVDARLPNRPAQERRTTRQSRDLRPLHPSARHRDRARTDHIGGTRWCG